MRRAKPEYLVITLGVNGISFMDEEWFIRDYTSLVQLVQAASPDTKIILNSIYPVADSYKYQKDTLYCAISLPNRNGVQEGKGVGLSYEMLKYFGDFTSSYVSIVPGSCDVSYLDTLSGGKQQKVILNLWLLV